jgi:hypothetical protein
MRYGEYTRFENREYRLYQTNEGKFGIVLRTSTPHVPGFHKVEEGLYHKVLGKNELVTNAYFIRTYARYKGFDFQVESYVNRKYLLVTDNYDMYQLLDLEQRERGVYQIFLDKSQIERMWEVRSKSYFNLPMPEGLKEIEEVPFTE